MDEHTTDPGGPRGASEEMATERPTDGEASGASDAWRDVLTRVDELGDAIGRWAKAAVDDPDNRRRAEELREHIEAMGRTVGDAIDQGAESESGRKVRDAAEKAGDAIKQFGERFGEEVFPRMASAFEGAAAKLHEAAERMEADGPEQYGEQDADEDVTL